MEYKGENSDTNGCYLACIDLRGSELNGISEYRRDLISSCLELLVSFAFILVLIIYNRKLNRSIDLL